MGEEEGRGCLRGRDRVFNYLDMGERKGERGYVRICVTGGVRVYVSEGVIDGGV